MSTNKVRVTMWPDRELEVSDAELLDLKRQGLVADAPSQPEAPRTTEVQRPVVSTNVEKPEAKK